MEIEYVSDSSALVLLLEIDYCALGTDMPYLLDGYSALVFRIELALCVLGRMFPEESDIIEYMYSGLPDMINGSVVAPKTKNLVVPIEVATELMDKKHQHFCSERQSETKESKDDNQQQQQNKRKIHGHRAYYTTGSGEKKPYGGSKPLCSKCNYHHDCHYALKCHKCNRVGHLAYDCRVTA
ncbi:reverse transcriptase domain-containing protein [Tanacetum coccineum]